MSRSTMASTHNSTAAPHVHMLGPGTLVSVFAVLVGLTVVTVAAAQFPIGSLEIWISLGIATVKAGLVAAYFMHLRYDKPLHALILVAALGFVGLFLALTLADSRAYQGDVQTGVRSSVGRATDF